MSRMRATQSQAEKSYSPEDYIKLNAILASNPGRAVVYRTYSSKGQIEPRLFVFDDSNNGRPYALSNNKPTMTWRCLKCRQIDEHWKSVIFCENDDDTITMEDGKDRNGHITIHKCKKEEFKPEDEAVKHLSSKKFPNLKMFQKETSRNEIPLSMELQQKNINIFFESEKAELLRYLENENWEPESVPAIYQQLFYHSKLKVLVKHSISKYYLARSAIILLRKTNDFLNLVEMCPDRNESVLLNMIEVFDAFNDRTRKLIIGKDDVKLGPKLTIEIYALAARSLQFIIELIQALKDASKEILSTEKHDLIKHFDSTSRDYQDHVDEILGELFEAARNAVVKHLDSWTPQGEAPTPAFQKVMAKIRKFYNGFSSVMPPSEITKILLRVHNNVKAEYRNILNQHGVTPQNALSYGLASADFDYYVENMRALPNCENFPNDTINDVYGKENYKKKTQEEQPSRHYPFLGTIDRRVLDFEKLCSVSFSYVNVYACMICF
uniref:Vacuolar protein sorting-associated protein 54 C-terminal domain-containing protein n=1 Tax=Panagrolaimus sp. ES5 TaxID=591445 RepID=A0AC34FHI5_9BILA